MVELSISTTDMIRKNFEKNCLCCSRTPEMRRCQDNRYLLIMTEKYSSLPIIKGMELDDQENMSIIFGSSFPKDQEFTQVISFSRECTNTPSSCLEHNNYFKVDPRRFSLFLQWHFWNFREKYPFHFIDILNTGIFMWQILLILNFFLNYSVIKNTNSYT